MTRLICWLLVSVAACLATVSVASAERRVALVLGNAAYHHTPRLLNPVRDAESIANKLRELDFEVIVGLDLTTSETEARIAQFARQVRGADIAAFYYAGHALQLSGANYLIPVNAELKDDTSLDFEAVQLDFILRQMSRETGARLVFLDASLANPLADRLSQAGGNSALGLAEVEAPAGGRGTLIASASGPNQVVEEVVGDHSPFSGALLAAIGTANISIADAVKKAAADTEAATKHKPLVVSSLEGDVVLRAVDLQAPLVLGEEAPAPPAAAQTPAPAPSQDQAAIEALRAKIPDLATDSAIFFDIPVQFGDPAIDGKSFAMLIQGKPRFSPVEGLDKKVWDNHCSACHQWTKERLCEQAKTYVTADTSVLRLEHPLGTRFKVALGRWAKNDCQ
ncbi:MAG: caspase family protein [Mesorhizobium sp.]|nr:caspase family protein [Mesorhizobium sp.]